MKFSQADDRLYDVVAVNIATSIVRVMGTGKTKPNAEAYVAMAVMRRGVEVEFYSGVPVGAYVDGDKWDGRTGAEI